MVTNNPQIAKMYPDLGVYDVEGSVLTLFVCVRDFVHQGYRLLTHPLSGSLKPGRIPYKTVILTTERAELDLDSLYYIENSIGTYHKTVFESPINWNDQLLADYAAIDLSHVEAALESIGR